MYREEREKGEIDMTTIKPIQATPELSGEDAEKLIQDVNRKPTKETIEWNEMLLKTFHLVKED